MSNRTDNSFLIISSGLGFYQQLLSGIRSYDELGNRLLTEIKAAHLFRQTERVRELSSILLRVPIKEYQLIAQYYLVWCDCRELKLHTDVLETVIEQSQSYKAKGLVARAAHEALRGNIDPMMYFYAEALKANPNISEYVDIVKAISAVKSVEGFHQSALKDLESLLPVIKHAEPFVYFDFLNSYAVELIENGRHDEAGSVSNIVVASPFAPHYPEWHETNTEANGEDNKILLFPVPESIDEGEQDSDNETKETYEEFDRMFEIADECKLNDMVADWLLGGITPEGFAKFFLSISNFKNVKRLGDIFDVLIHCAFLATPEAIQAEEDWKNRLLAELEGNAE